MKKFILRQNGVRILLIAIGALIASEGYSQITISSTDLIEGCSNVLIDTGGSEGEYSANESEMVTICPTEPDTTIWLEWSVFELDGASTITIYDGDSQFAPILAQGSGTHPGGPYA